jgi:hypothetical protein
MMQKLELFLVNNAKFLEFLEVNAMQWWQC